MISLDKLNEDERFIFKAAYLYYQVQVNKVNGELDIKQQKALEKTITMYGDDVSDKDQLREYLEQEISMVREMGEPLSITSEEVRNSKWWTEYKGEADSLEYWSRYEKYLTNDKQWSQGTIQKNIINTTDIIMNAIADPNEGSAIERKGMVFGYVQSGKTANYIGVINKAIDAGYKIIIVLAGMHNNLRSQTQSRIDEEVLGYETSAEWKKTGGHKDTVIGVGKYKVSKGIQTATHRDEDGDFKEVQGTVSFELDNPLVLIVKKNSKVLRNLISYFTTTHMKSIDPITNKAYMSAKYPMLLIDDEADQASVNTGYNYENGNRISDDASTINALVRDLFHLFECRSYIGYTATPYANIFIPNNVRTDEHGEDLFPDDFIVCLPKPSMYIGTQEFFGDERKGLEEMPLRRRITTRALRFINHRQRTVAMELPDELKKAIMSFMLSIAIRNLRGYNTKPNSMLIHVTRINEIQAQVGNRVEQFFELWGEKILDGDTKTIDELYSLWSKDYDSTTKKMRKKHKKFMEDAEVHDWDIIFSEVKRLLREDSIKIRCINGSSGDSLQYKDNNGKQYNVIAIGGDKLSRGLTLEGLSVSYFSRDSKMYDTLMQMGRWFGFRNGYVDLCRLYVQDSLYSNFKHISFATEDLREQIEYMNEDENNTPEKFGLRVATHPNMKISSPKKVQSGAVRTLTFSNVYSQSRAMDVDAKKYNRNFNAIDEFLKTCGEPVANYWDSIGRKDNTSKHIFWKNVDGHLVSSFLGKYETSRYANKSNSKYMQQYIEDQMTVGGLLGWTVCLVNIGEIDENDPTKHIKIGNQIIGPGMQRKDIKLYEDERSCSIQTLTPEDYQFYDFTGKQMEQVREKKELYKRQGKRLSNDTIRKEIRKRDRGLLLLCPIDTEKSGGRNLKDNSEKHQPPIGIAVAFPDNEQKGRLIPYRINDVGLREEGENDDFIG